MNHIEEPCETASVSAQRSERVKQYSPTTNYNSRPTSTTLYDNYCSLIKRTYEEPYHWYYIVFKPFNDSYNPIKYQNCLSIVSDYCRTLSDVGILSREILSAKIHANALILTYDKDISHLHGKNITKRGLKYKLSVELVIGYTHRSNVLGYMFKEADIRDFSLYFDHMSFYRGGALHLERNPLCTHTTRPEVLDDQSDDPNEPVPTLTKPLFCMPSLSLRF